VLCTRARSPATKMMNFRLGLYVVLPKSSAGAINFIWTTYLGNYHNCSTLYTIQYIHTYVVFSEDMWHLINKMGNEASRIVEDIHGNIEQTLQTLTNNTETIDHEPIHQTTALYDSEAPLSPDQIKCKCIRYIQQGVQ
jgi:hypothetical protein